MYFESFNILKGLSVISESDIHKPVLQECPEIIEVYGIYLIKNLDSEQMTH